MSDKLVRKRAELALLEAEEEFTAKKVDGSVTREDKDAIRALRQEFRLKYREVKPGAAPDVISTKAGN